MNRKQRRAAAKQEVTRGAAPRPGKGGDPSDDTAKLLATAIAYHQAGRHAEAEAVYQQILAIDPNQVDSLHLLGVVAHQLGKNDAAVALIGKAIALNGNDSSFHNNLGIVLKGQGRLDEAVGCYRRALVIKPDYAEAHNNLGNALGDQGKLAEAAGCYRQALVLKPNYAEAHNNLGNALRHQGKLAEAVDCCRRALVLKRDYVEAHNCLGNALRDQGKLDEAVDCYRQALVLKPDHAEAHNNLGNALWDQGKLDEAVGCCRRALALKPTLAEAHNNLGNVLRDQGKLDEAVACYRQALALKPDYPGAHSNLLSSLNYHMTLPPGELLAAHRRWDERHGTAARTHHANRRDPDRRLRIGYVSPDFRRHSVAFFLEPLLRHHDRAAVEVFCYAEVAQPDAVTGRLQALADHWRSTVGMSDAALVQQIGADGVDILVDVAGHTANNRLPAFAAKPAPVQVSWLGYPNTTGLAAMDYRLVDAVTDPGAEADGWASETLLRLAGGFLCYGPPVEAPEPVSSFGPGGAVTFGSFNNPAKLSAATLDTWVALLLRLPEAQLVLKGPPFADAATRALFQARFAALGVAAMRVTLLGHLPDLTHHLSLYRRIDIALDPFPYNGTTTTCEALWMGVPVVTLLGDRHAGRVGASLLTRLGLDELIARDAEEYVAIATGLATNPARLISLRAGLRARMAASPLCDTRNFADKMESAYRNMWRRYCAGTDQPVVSCCAYQRPASRCAI
jgi:protein O-GlcNAc transferase